MIRADTPLLMHVFPGLTRDEIPDMPYEQFMQFREFARHVMRMG